MDYKEYAREIETVLPTVINTKINKDSRISSIYRRFANPNFEHWAWETILWNGNHVEKEYNTLDSVKSVIDLHTKIVKSYQSKRS